MTNKRILIVEDSMDVGRMLQTAIKTLSSDYTVTWIRSAEEAILETSLHKLDLVVTDIRLPGIDGFELIRRVRRRLPEVHVIIISGLPEHELEKQIREVKPDFVLRKPVVVSTFLDKVLAALNKAEEKPSAGKTAVGPGADGGAVLPSKLTDVLTRLHGASNAQMVLLVDAEGVVAADVGAPKTGLAVEIKKIKDMLAAADGLALAGRKALIVVRGALADWILQPVGSEFTLALLLPAGGSVLRLALALEEIQRAQVDLAASFGLVVLPPEAAPAAAAVEALPAALETAAEIPLPAAEKVDADADLLAALQAAAPVVTEPEPEPIPEDPAALEAFAALFGQPEAKPVNQDAASFWESAAEKSGSVSINPEAITFDEAQKLGLAPDEDEDKSG